MKNNVIKAERRVLKELGFCVHVKHPHKMIVTYLQILECERHSKLVQTAWNYMNDSLRTDVFVRYSPETIACACIYLTARQLQIPLPKSPPWYSLLGASEEDLQAISLLILRVYSRPKKTFEELDKLVDKCKVVIQDAKMKAKELAAGGVRSTAATPNPGFSPSSRHSSPKSGTISPHTRLKKKLRDDGAGSSAGSIGSRERNGHHRGDRSRSRSPRSRSHTPQRNSRIHSRSPSHHSSSHSSYTNSPSRSPHDHRNRYDSPHKHRKHNRRSRESGEHVNRSKHFANHPRKRKRSKSHSRSRSRSRSRTPRAYKHRRASPHRERRTRRGYSRSRSKERVHKSSKRDRVREDGHSRSRDRHRR